MNGDWAQYETVRGKGSTVNCMFCGRKPQILEKGFHDGSHVFSISCPHCWNKHFRDKKETGVDITVYSETIYPGIRDWNKINGAYLRGYHKALDDINEDRPHGEWKKTPKAVMGEGYMWYCDKCGNQVYQDSSRPYPSENFCPRCGSPMNEKALEILRKRGEAECC